MSQRTHLFVKQKYTQARACPVYRLVRVRSSTEMKYDYENDDDYESIRQYQSNPDWCHMTSVSTTLAVACLFIASSLSLRSVETYEAYSTLVAEWRHSTPVVRRI